MGGLAGLVILIYQIKNYLFFQNLIELAESGGLPSNHVFYRFIDDRKNEMMYFSLITSVLIFCVSIGAGLFLSNKIAGPLHRLSMHLKKSQDTKKFSKIYFRENDYFKEVADQYNDHIEHLVKVNKE